MAFTSIPGTSNSIVGQTVFSLIPTSVSGGIVDGVCAIFVTAGVSATGSVIRSGSITLTIAASLSSTAGLAHYGSAELNSFLTILAAGAIIAPDSATGFTTTDANLTATAEVIPPPSGYIAPPMLIKVGEVVDDSVSPFTTTASTVPAIWQDFYVGRHQRIKAVGFSDNLGSIWLLKENRDTVRANAKLVTFFEIAEMNTEFSPESTTTIGDVTAITNTNPLGRLLYLEAEVNSPLYSRLSRLSLEVLRAPSPFDVSILHTQTHLESLIQPLGNMRMTANSVEVAYSYNNAYSIQTSVETIFEQIAALRMAIINQQCIEVIHSMKSSVFLSQYSREILRGLPAEIDAVLTHLSVEVARNKTEIDITPVRAKQMAIERVMNSDVLRAYYIQFLTETIRKADPIQVRVIQYLIEDMQGDGDPRARSNHAAVEATLFNFGGVRSNHTAVEVLVRLEWDPTVSSLINNPKFSV